MNRVYFLLPVFLLSLVSQAQKMQLNLEDALQYALEHKAEAVKARLDIENSTYQIQEVRANALPQITANGTLTYNAILQETAMDFMGESMILKMGLPWQSGATVSLNQQLFNQAVFTGLKAARSTREFYLINAQLTEEDIIEKVATNYFEVYKTKSQLETLNQTIANTSRVRDVIQNLFNNGLSTKIDLDRTNVSLNNLKGSKQRLQNALQLQENSLKYLIGLDINTEIELPDNTFEITENAFIDETAHIEKRVEFQLLEKQKELLELNKKATQAQGYPSLSLNANYGYLGLGENFPWFESYPGAYWSDYASVGLNLSIPLFQGGSIKAKTKQAQVDIERVEADYRDTQLALDLAFRNAVTQMNNSLITIGVQKENVQLAAQVLQNIENNYKNGLAGLTDLLDAENSYAEAQNSYTNALLDYKLAEIQLIRAKGELTTLVNSNN